MTSITMICLLLLCVIGIREALANVQEELQTLLQVARDLNFQADATETKAYFETLRSLPRIEFITHWHYIQETSAIGQIPEEIIAHHISTFTNPVDFIAYTEIMLDISPLVGRISLFNDLFKDYVKLVNVATNFAGALDSSAAAGKVSATGVDNLLQMQLLLLHCESLIGQLRKGMETMETYLEERQNQVIEMHKQEHPDTYLKSMPEIEFAMLPTVMEFLSEMHKQISKIRWGHDIHFLFNFVNDDHSSILESAHAVISQLKSITLFAHEISQSSLESLSDKQKIELMYSTFSLFSPEVLGTLNIPQFRVVLQNKFVKDLYVQSILRLSASEFSRFYLDCDRYLEEQFHLGEDRHLYGNPDVFLSVLVYPPSIFGTVSDGGDGEMDLDRFSKYLFLFVGRECMEKNSVQYCQNQLFDHDAFHTMLYYQFKKESFQKILASVTKLFAVIHGYLDEWYRMRQLSYFFANDGSISEAVQRAHDLLVNMDNRIAKAYLLVAEILSSTGGNEDFAALHKIMQSIPERAETSEIPPLVKGGSEDFIQYCIEYEAPYALIYTVIQFKRYGK